jgi:hypothetical protein
MTIVVAVSVADGLVLASDSATTQQIELPNGGVETINIWNSANKIFNLRRGLPIGAMTWGRADFLSRSIASHCKDLRALLSGEDGQRARLAIDPNRYDMRTVVERVRDHFAALYGQEPGGLIGFLVGGYSPRGGTPEVWQVEIDERGSRVGQPLRAGEAGIFQQGQPEAIERLVDGVSGSLRGALVNLGVEEPYVDAYVDAIKAQIALPMVHAAMPLAEAIELAEFLVDATIKFVRFTPGDAFVGGPIEVAAVTRHEGYKWIKRKHYYSSDLNP